MEWLLTTLFTILPYPVYEIPHGLLNYGAFRQLNLLEGILPALESSHALAHAVEFAATLRKDQNIIVNLSGRGDKDIPTMAKIDGISIG